MADADQLRDAISKATSEDALFELVRDATKLGGWRLYHTHDSRRSHSGFPDVVAVNPALGRLVFAELKSARGIVSADQRGWLDVLGKVRSMNHTAYQDVGILPDFPEVYLWRPKDADQIIEVLLGHRIHRAEEDVPYSSRDSSTREGG